MAWVQSLKGLLTPPGSASMRAHPIPPVTEPLQYRAIGLVRGTYAPTDTEQLTRGTLTDAQGVPLGCPRAAQGVPKWCRMKIKSPWTLSAASGSGTGALTQANASSHQCRSCRCARTGR